MTPTSETTGDKGAEEEEEQFLDLESGASTEDVLRLCGLDSILPCTQEDTTEQVLAQLMCCEDAEKTDEKSTKLVDEDSDFFDTYAPMISYNEPEKLICSAFFPPVLAVETSLILMALGLTSRVQTLKQALLLSRKKRQRK